MRMVTMYIRLESGVDATAKLFVMDRDDVWADGGEVRLTPGTWICLSVNVGAPDYADDGFDPTEVRQVGVEIKAVGDAVFYVDDVGY